MSSAITPSVYNLTLPQLTELLASLGEPGFRAKQIYRQLYVKLAGSFADMSDLPAALRSKLAGRAAVQSLELQHVQAGDRGLTRKALFHVPGGPPIESVLMIYDDRATVCVSTQSGCAMGCTFCATAQLGFRLNLSAGQMIEQVLWAARELAAMSPSRSLTNVVYMGMGEPFNNYDAWWESVVRLHDPKGFNMGARSFTVSTVGIVPGILRLADEELPVNLAISLHAANDQLRSQLVPVNRKYPLAEIVRATREYTEKTHRRVSFEYVLLQGVNDALENARELAGLCRGATDKGRPLLCHVNLIPWNPVPGAPLSPSDRRRVLDFQNVLEDHKVACTVRVQRGVDIAAACGQLAGIVSTP
jgi:23S rRNA (adenine2503-C2)-methyltransferase